MLKYTIIKDKKTGVEKIETDMRGKSLLTTSLLNKGTAFTDRERLKLGLLGKLPSKVQTLEEQVSRTRRQYDRYESAQQKNIFLNNLHDKNEILFYKLVSENLSEMMPMIYTPMVGAAVKLFSHEFRQPRGIYISYDNKDKIEEILNNRTHANVDLIVVTDGERVLGLGDQGVGAMDIALAKLKLYTLCGGINPYHVLPVMLDVGTNNGQLLNDPLYLGWHNARITGKEYDDFIDDFVNSCKKTFPNVYIHWEDFGRDNARKILEHYKDDLCTFNDDMQGTAVVTIAAILSASKIQKIPFDKQNIIIFGAGTAGCGIADQLVGAMQHEGLSYEEATARIWLYDRDGLITSDSPSILKFQAPYVKNSTNLKGMPLAACIEHIKPTGLIGCSAQPGTFTEDVITKMAQVCVNPFVFPLSNPNEFAEAHPKDILKWSDGRALIATGSPFDRFEHDGREVSIAQCNNALAFPGIGLAVLATKAKKVNDEMLWEACLALSEYRELHNIESLLPTIGVAKETAKHVGARVAECAIKTGVATVTNTNVGELIADTFWEPYYREFVVK